MATRNPVWTVVALPHNADVYGAGAGPRIEAPWLLVRITWTAVASATSDVCTPAPVGWLVDKSIQITGTVTDVDINGSNDGTNYVRLNDPQGNALDAINAAKIEQILETTLFIQPAVVAGDCTFTIFGRIPVV